MVTRLLVLGANGMLGGSIFRHFSSSCDYVVLGIVRSHEARKALISQGFTNTNMVENLLEFSHLENLLEQFKPDYVINCVGIIKQRKDANSYLSAIQINSLFPHQLAALASKYNSKLVHFSTDCVFDGKSGMYSENDRPNSSEIYGLSKLLGEINYAPHLTLRTSMVGHELAGNLSLVDWFLSQSGSVKGFSCAVFSGMPTVYIAEVLHEHVFNGSLFGLFNLSVEPINKFELLVLVREIYKKDIVIEQCNRLIVDRSLNSSKFRETTGFKAPSWHSLIEKMKHEFDTYFTH